MKELFFPVTTISRGFKKKFNLFFLSINLKRSATSWLLKKFCLSEPLLVLIEYVPYGDLLGYLRKSRGLNDTYYKDPDIKPQTSLTSQQLMKFAWQIADGMSYLSSRSVSVFITSLSVIHLVTVAKSSTKTGLFKLSLATFASLDAKLQYLLR